MGTTDHHAITSSASTKVMMINVNEFGAKADGTDDSKAFKKAWEKACSSSTTEAVLVVPKNKNYLLKPVRFSGPCKSNISIKIDGAIEASADRSDYKRDRRHWIVFENIQNFTVEGNGTLNGNGDIWWKNSCKINKSRALTFDECKNLRVRNFSIKDAQQMHLTFQKCINVEAINLLITAPEKSPNTDGIHVTHTQNIQIANCVISTGDDCISIVSGSQSVQAVNITCGPGHGISIGSLGSGNSEAHVSDVKVDTARLNGTTNGVRIKTWQGGSGNASNITFQNISMYNVKNPIIIDQNYCDHKDDPCKEQESAVQISDVLYKNITGTSASEVAVKLDCSKKHPCRQIVLQDINLVRERGETAKAFCNNVKWTQIGEVLPGCSSKINDVFNSLLHFLIGY
ncbi:Glycoside hydrolase [Macleaya cordata]|uniref:endo-polygalacturonase n=1 Tax=Macleaya cordata TaxID=56857 RepID=A0A200PS17_MACCD|nr:Glycoside hydrolase [Macleaya cordata]